jgi:hypothetical protein
VRRRHAHGRACSARSTTCARISDVYVSGRCRVAASSHHRVLETHASLGRAPERLAPTRPNEALGGQARLVAARLHECAVGTKRNRLPRDVRNENRIVSIAIPQRMPTAWPWWPDVRATSAPRLVDASEVSARTLRTDRSRSSGSRGRLAFGNDRRMVGARRLQHFGLATTRPRLLAIRRLRPEAVTNAIPASPELCAPTTAASQQYAEEKRLAAS